LSGTNSHFLDSPKCNHKLGFRQQGGWILKINPRGRYVQFGSGAFSSPTFILAPHHLGDTGWPARSYCPAPPPGSLLRRNEPTAPQNFSRSMYKLSNLIFAALVVLSAGSPAFGQVGRRSTWWSWTMAASHHEPIVQVSLDGGTGSGILIHVDQQQPHAGGFLGYCLTAYHVVEDDQERRAIKVRYRNGRSASRCKVIQYDAERDLALLWVWVPPGILGAVLASEPAQFGDQLELAGLGGGGDPECCLRSFSATASAPTTADRIYADVSLLVGDSGGPVFNDRKELVGIISGGWFWWDSGIVTDDGVQISTTWPARAANLQVLQKMIDTIPD
jgi:serine protease Do